MRNTKIKTLIIISGFLLTGLYMNAFITMMTNNSNIANEIKENDDNKEPFSTEDLKYCRTGFLNNFRPKHR